MELDHRTVTPAVPGQGGRHGILAAARLVVPLDGAGHRLGLVGGKAASLDALVRRGFRVPPAFTVTTAAYRRFTASSPRLEEWLDDLSHRAPPSPDRADDARAEVERRFLATPVPADLVAAVTAHLTRIAPTGEPVAVRSSATTEDLEATSFAGQHLSVLDVTRPEDVLDSLRRVWSSLWYPAPRAYRERMGVPEADLAMAAVVQRMVPAERSGVCFTVDPTRPATLRLEVVEGLGEALVSGRATPEVHQLLLPSLRPLDGRPVDPLLREVARASLRIEEEMGGRPQDVEWSAVGDQVWLLQSRPITTTHVGVVGDGFDTPNRAGDIYAPSGVSEMLPGVLSPLVWTTNGPMLEEGFRRLFARLGVIPRDLTVQPFAVLARIRGQAALDLTRIKEAARRMAGGTGAEVERQYLGQVVSEAGDEPRPSALQRARNTGAAVRALRLRRAAQVEAETFERAVDEVLALRTDLNELRSSELVAYRARVRDLAAAGIAAEVAVAVAAVASYRALEVALERWVGDRAPRWAQRLTRDAAGGTRGACGCAAAIWNVFQNVANSDALEAAIAQASPTDAEAHLRAVGPVGKALVDGLWGALDRLGSSAVYGGPTWAEQPEYVWQTILGCLRTRIERGKRDPLDEARQGAAEALTLLEHRLTSTWRWRLTRVVTGQLVDVRLRMLRTLAGNARTLLSRRESVKAAVLALGGEERRAVLVLADRLARRGVLRSPADVELCADWEIDALVTGEAPVSRDELERRAEAMDAFRSAPPLPALVDHHGQEAVTTMVDTGGVTGWGASPGVHRGPVRIIRDVARSAALNPGDVLVAPATDPSWTPLFLVAGAVVVERGGPLSHAAIVARELGVPAVLNAAAATQKLADGAIVKVDGDEGTVTVIDAARAQGEVPEELADSAGESA